ncbi:2-C-methyl-D-erythritol 2,4-cyclodiphosphate synthase [Natronospora cellulosivora (SeqCode)]
MRIGIGFDVHKFKEGRKLIIGGVNIPYLYGLLGHSDADVLTHALMDAILGALSRGDIGKHFPDNDVQYKDANSLELLEKVNKFLIMDNYSISNIDMIIMAEEPKMAPFYPEIKKKYSEILNTKSDQINIKATTTEKLGFVGRKEGIAAQAIVLLNRGGEQDAS